MGAIKMRVTTEKLMLAKPFRISGYLFESFDAVVVTLTDGRFQGRGEGNGVYYLRDDAPHMLLALDAARAAIENGIDRHALRSLMPAGGARNAVDCALWDLEAARAGMAAWQLAGIAAPRALRTTFTLGADTPERMAQTATSDGYTEARAIKVKLTGDPDLDIARVTAIRAARPDVWLGVDGNQGFTIDQLPELAKRLHALDVSLLEQPLERGREADVEGFASPIPLAADESVLTLEDIAGAVGRFDVINIKLDKCGGLTEGLLMAAEARRFGMRVMVGNMGGSSLAMAPSFILGQGCDIVDLDGPIFLAQDRASAVDYRDGDVWAGPAVWGSGWQEPAGG